MVDKNSFLKPIIFHIPKGLKPARRTGGVCKKYQLGKSATLSESNKALLREGLKTFDAVGIRSDAIHPGEKKKKTSNNSEAIPKNVNCNFLKIKPTDNDKN